MFRKRSQPKTSDSLLTGGTVSSVLGPGVTWKGKLGGTGGVRIEGTFEGEIAIRGLLVIGEQGRVTCDHVHADIVVVAGILKGNITAQKVEIRSTGRVWGDVNTIAFATEEGAFLRGQIQMKDEIAKTTLPPQEEETPPPETGASKPDATPESAPPGEPPH